MRTGLRFSSCSQLSANLLMFTVCRPTSMDYKDALCNSFLGCSTMIFNTNRNIDHLENVKSTLEEKTVLYFDNTNQTQISKYCNKNESLKLLKLH